MKILLRILCICLLGSFPTLTSECPAQFFTRAALEEGIIRAKRDFSCTLRIVVDLQPLKDDLKTTILPAAIEKTLDDTLANLQRLKPNNHKKMLEQIEKRGGKTAYLKHILDTPHMHGPQRSKVEGGYSEWVKFPGSLDTYTINLGTFSVGGRASATLVSVEGSQLKGLDNRVFVSAAHAFEDILDPFEGKYPSELLQYARAQVEVGDNDFHSYRIKELFIPKEYKNHLNNDNDIVIGILEEAVTEDIEPAKIQRNYFEEADRPVLPQVLWQCGFPSRLMVTNALEEVVNALEEVVKWLVEKPLGPELIQHVKKQLSFFLTQTKIAGCIIINGYDNNHHRCVSSYNNHIPKKSPDPKALQIMTMDASYVYIEHQIYPNEILSLTPKESFADLYEINRNNIPFLIEKPWTYSDYDDIVGNTVLNQLFQELEEEGEENFAEIYHRTTYRSISGQSLFTMTYFKHLPELILFSSPGMSGGGVFALDNDALNLVAIIISGKRVDVSYKPFQDYPEFGEIQSTFGANIKESKILVWPFWKEFLEECEENREESRFLHIIAAKTITDKSSSSMAKIPAALASAGT